MMSWIARSAFNTTTQLVAWVLSNRCFTSSGMDAFDIFVHQIKSTIEHSRHTAATAHNNTTLVPDIANYESLGCRGCYTDSQKPLHGWVHCNSLHPWSRIFLESVNQSFCLSAGFLKKMSTEFHGMQFAFQGSSVSHFDFWSYKQK